jgi:hypothetical protein
MIDNVAEAFAWEIRKVERTSAFETYCSLALSKMAALFVTLSMLNFSTAQRSNRGKNIRAPEGGRHKRTKPGLA